MLAISRKQVPMPESTLHKTLLYQQKLLNYLYNETFAYNSIIVQYANVYVVLKIDLESEWIMLKKIVFILLTCIMAFAPVSLKADGERHALSIDVFLPLMSPVSRAFGEMAWIPVNIKYQYLIMDHLAMMGKAGINYSWASGEKILEVYPVLALEYHPFDIGLHGFYIGPSLLLNYCHYWNDYSVVNNPDHTYRIAPGINIGWEFVLQSNVVIDVTFGLGYGYNEEVNRYRKTHTDYTVDESIGGIFIGYCF